jgi:hypothetical protein
MKDKTLEKVRAFSLSVLMIQLLSTPFLAKTSEQSQPPSLKATTWEFSTSLDSNHSLQIVQYGFRSSGRVERLIITKDMVGIPDRIQYNTSGVGRPEDERGRATVVPGIPPGQIVDTRGDTGTYEQNGSSVHLEFSDQKINAIIHGNRMEGETISGTSKAKWVVTRRTGDANILSTSSDGVVRRSDPVPDPDRKFRPSGSYRGRASEVLVENRFGISWGEAQVNITVKVKGIDNDGNVMAEILVDGRNYRQGTLSGNTDAAGTLQLTGDLVDSSGGTFQTRLSLILDEGSLTKGIYVSRFGIFTITGKLSF